VLFNFEWKFRVFRVLSRDQKGIFMIILAIDPGYGRCGWAVLSKAKQSQNLNLKSQISNNILLSTYYKLHNPILIACDLIQTHKSQALPDRLKELYESIEYLIKKYKPQELAIESLFWFKNQKTAMSVSQARGVIIVCAKNHNLEISEYTPLQVKQAVVGYGKATKEQIAKLIKLHLGRQTMPVQDDTADAVAIGLTHLQTVKLDRTKAHEQIREKSPENNIFNKNKIVYKELSYQINGLLFNTYKQLGGMLQERFYYSYLKELFTKNKINYQFQKNIKFLNSKCHYFIDFVIDDKIVLEIKSTSKFIKKDIDQTMNYLRSGNWKLAILARFGKNGVVIQRLLKGK